MDKPIIGIVMKHLYNDAGRPDMFVRDEVKQAIFDNNGVAIGIILPKDENVNVDDKWVDNLTDKERESLWREISLCDGIILQGGMTCDTYEMVVAKYCYENDIPVLGICAGQNALVRALGGTTMLVDDPAKHNRKYVDYVHKIEVEPGSKFYDVVGAERMWVNSRHEMTIDECPGLKKVAFCDDGYPDVVEATNRKFYIGVRFHPESLYKKDERMNNIFVKFVKACQSNI